ncbi:MAG: phosphoribosyl-AMP cyclohydrolase [Angustibacter sp.]
MPFLGGGVIGGGATRHDGGVTAPARPSSLAPDVAAQLKRDDHGLVCAVVQQRDTGEVLMVGWMDDEALHRTLTTGRVTFWSRSRQSYWRKGDTSGHAQWVHGVALDCDGDALLVRVQQHGSACHTGSGSCFAGRALPVTGAVTTADPSSGHGSAGHGSAGHGSAGHGSAGEDSSSNDSERP